jgi:hypothetical protein
MAFFYEYFKKLNCYKEPIFNKQDSCTKRLEIFLLLNQQIRREACIDLDTVYNYTIFICKYFPLIGRCLHTSTSELSAIRTEVRIQKTEEKLILMRS